MKTTILAITAFAAQACLQAAVIAQWNFNSPVPDAQPSTGTLAPALSIGAATATAVGGLTTNFSSGSGSHDPAPASDDSAWNTTGYPKATNSNKSAGVQFSVDTTSYENISVNWDQRNSSTASRYSRFQYTLDGVTFIDADVISLFADSTFTNKSVNLSSIAGAANNPWFGFRLVSEFESTATGSGTNAYVATKDGSTYGTSGTIRFDMVTLSGTLIPGANTPPGISTLADQTLRVGQSTWPLSFFVWDAQDAATELALGCASSNPAVIPEANILLAGSGDNRTVTISASNQPGSAVITLYVIDTGGMSNHTSFTVTVLAANTAPVISTCSRANTTADTPTPPIDFTISDLETPPAGLLLSGASANPALVPNSNIAFAGTGTNRTVTLRPAPGQTGVAPITITVSDRTNTASATFPLMVTPSAAVVFYDPFAYPDGSLLTNSVFLWTHRGGTQGECQVTGGHLLITAAQTEDVVGPLVGGPYRTNSGTVLYAAFKAMFLSLPKAAPGLFAHFANGSQLRGRLYAGTTNASPGRLRLAVANGSDSTTQLPMDLETNLTYTLVTRYEVDTATTTLWLNPAGEADPHVTASDQQNPLAIASYGFRQDADVGASLLVSELKVGRAFAAVLPGLIPQPPRVDLQCNGNAVVLRWTNSGFTLQAAPFATGPFTNITAAVSPFTNIISAPARFFRLKSK